MSTEFSESATQEDHVCGTIPTPSRKATVNHELTTLHTHLSTPETAPAKEQGNLELGAKAAELLLKMAGEDLGREGLLDTPLRVAKSYKALFSGYELSPQEAVGQGVFTAEGTGLVSVDDVEFFSLCEHHILPFWGNVRVSYYPDSHILGLSKIPRLIDVFARRVQVQERLTRLVAESMQELIKPRAIVVTVKAQHMCMMMRGVEKHASATRTEYCFGLENLSDYERERILGHH